MAFGPTSSPQPRRADRRSAPCLPPACPHQQRLEHRDFARGKVRRASSISLTTHGVERQTPCVRRALEPNFPRRTSARTRASSSGQLERLRHVVVRTQIETLHAVLQRVARGQDEAPERQPRDSGVGAVGATLRGRRTSASRGRGLPDRKPGSPAYGPRIRRWCRIGRESDLAQRAHQTIGEQWIVLYISRRMQLRLPGLNPIAGYRADAALSRRRQRRRAVRPQWPRRPASRVKFDGSSSGVVSSPRSGPLVISLLRHAGFPAWRFLLCGAFCWDQPSLPVCLLSL